MGFATLIAKTKPDPVVDKKPNDSKEAQRKKRLDKMIGWMKDRIGKVSYDMDNPGRLSEGSCDCASAVYRSMIYAGILPKNQVVGNTDDLFRMGDEGKYLKEIKEAEVAYGDIFVSGIKYQSAGANGHTGFIIDKNTIIHCNASDDGINITPRKDRQGAGPFTYYRIIHWEA